MTSEKNHQSRAVPARSETTRPGCARKWLFRLAALAAGLSVFVVAEAACRLAGWGRPSDFEDPFVGFSEIHPLFVLSDDAARYETAPSRRPFFKEDSFGRTKADREFRIFVLGGSTVQGSPYSIPTSFTTWLELELDAADPRRDWEVVNCGGVSYASYRLVPILEEVLRYEPDLIIVCTGHNEFLEHRTYGHIPQTPAVLAVPQRWVHRLRTYQLLRAGVARLSGPGEPPDRDRPVLKSEADALLDYRDGLKAYHRDDEWHAGVVAHYEQNLRRMA
ncbi:MAG: GDSL-type esterase/lipase family protein, partial [Planctomycetaceae bacterium]